MDKQDAAEATRQKKRASDGATKRLVLLPTGPAATAANDAAEIDPAFAEAIDKARAELEAASAAAGGLVPQPMFESAREIDEDRSEDNEPPDIVRGLVPDKGLTVIGGPPKDGKKTWISAELSISIASGTKAFGTFETGEPRHVARILLEDKRGSTRRRHRAVLRGKGLDTDTLDRIHVASKPNINLLDLDSLAWIVASVRALPEMPIAVFIDPLRDAHKGKEVEDMDAVSRMLRLLMSVLGCGVVVTHHVRKGQQQQYGKESGAPGDDLRGGGELRGRLDAGIYPKKASGEGGDGVGTFELDVRTESRDGQPAGNFHLTLNIEDDEKHRAHRATWKVTTGAEVKQTKEEQANEKTRANVLRALEAMHADEGEAEYFGITPIAKHAGHRKEKVTVALHMLLQDGRVEQSLSRSTSDKGWRLSRPHVLATSSDVLKDAPGGHVLPSSSPLGEDVPAEDVEDSRGVHSCEDVNRKTKEGT